MTSFSSSDREVIRYLFSFEDWADLYELHIRYQLSPAQVIDIIQRLELADLAVSEGLTAKLTEAGRKWVVEARRDIFFAADKSLWSAEAARPADPAIAIGTPYLPDLRLVDQEFFAALGMERRAKNGTQ